MQWKSISDGEEVSFITLYLAYNAETGEYFIGTFDADEEGQWFEDQDGIEQKGITQYCEITNPFEN
mgnify:CR=1 FL=1